MHYDCLHVLTASKYQQTGTTSFLGEISNVEAILNSIFSSIAPQTQQKKTDIEIFTHVHGRRHLENCLRFLSPEAGECATGRHQPGSSSWARINVNGNTEVGLARTGRGTVQPS